MNLPFYGAEEVHDDEAPLSDDTPREPSRDLHRTWSDVASFEANAARKTEDAVGKLLTQLFARTHNVKEVERAISSPRIMWNPYRRPQGRGVKDKLQNGQIFEWRSRVAVDSLRLNGTRIGGDAEESTMEQIINNTSATSSTSSSNNSATRVRSASQSISSHATSSTAFNVYQASDSLMHPEEESAPGSSTHSIHIATVGLDLKLSRPLQMHKDASLLDERNSLMIFNIDGLDRRTDASQDRIEEGSELSTEPYSCRDKKASVQPLPLEAKVVREGDANEAQSAAKPGNAIEFPQWALYGSTTKDTGSGSFSKVGDDYLTQGSALQSKSNLLLTGTSISACSPRTNPLPEDEVFWSHGSVPVLEEVFVLHEVARSKNAPGRANKVRSASADRARSTAPSPRTLGQSDMLLGSHVQSRAATTNTVDQNPLSEVFEETVEQLFDMIWADVGVPWAKRTLGIHTNSGIFQPPIDNPRTPSPPRSVQVKSPVSNHHESATRIGVLRQPMSASTAASQKQAVQYVLPSALAARLPSDIVLPNPVRSKRQDSLRPKTGPAVASRLADVERPNDTTSFSVQMDLRKDTVQHPPRQAFESKSREQSPASRRTPQPLPQQRYTMSPSRNPRPTESPKPTAVPPIPGASKNKSALGLRKIVHSRTSTRKIHISDVVDKGTGSPSLLPRPRPLQPQQLEQSVERMKAGRASPQRVVHESSPGVSLLPGFRQPRDLATSRRQRSSKEFPNK